MYIEYRHSCAWNIFEVKPIYLDIVFIKRKKYIFY